MPKKPQPAKEMFHVESNGNITTEGNNASLINSDRKHCSQFTAAELVNYPTS